MKPPYADKKVYNPGIKCAEKECKNYVRDDNDYCDSCIEKRDEELEVEKFNAAHLKTIFTNDVSQGEIL